MELRFLSFSFDVPNGRVELMLIFLFRYSLAQEHGDLINLHDWFQAFKTIVLQNTNKRKQKSKQSQLPKKRKDMNGSGNENEASIQYPLYFLFYRASLISIRHNTSDLCHLLLHRHAFEHVKKLKDLLFVAKFLMEKVQLNSSMAEVHLGLGTLRM